MPKPSAKWCARPTFPGCAKSGSFRRFDRDSLQKKLKEVVKAGGEGLVLHRADAPYQTGRSDVLLKLKPWLDAEAEVVGHQPGKGKHAGALGALRVRTEMTACFYWERVSPTNSVAIHRQSAPW